MLLENRAWAGEMRDRDPDFFLRHVDRQNPEVLWIGCSDSRVPAEYILNAQPGDLFVHRNIANLASESDLSFMSVLQYAVVELKVKHIVVCGHYGCGGVNACMTSERKDLPYVSRKLTSVKDTYHKHRQHIETLETHDARLNRLVTLNVIEQVELLSKNRIIQAAWHTSADLFLHGWVYQMEHGTLIQAITIDAAFTQTVADLPAET